MNTKKGNYFPEPVDVRIYLFAYYGNIRALGTDTELKIAYEIISNPVYADVLARIHTSRYFMSEEDDTVVLF